MMFRRSSIGSVVPALEWSAFAREDLLSIIDYISDDNLAAAIKLKTEIEARVAALAKRPKLYRIGRVSGTREMVVRPNYIVIYSEDPTTVRILRILHAARQWPADGA